VGNSSRTCLALGLTDDGISKAADAELMDQVPADAHNEAFSKLGLSHGGF